MYGNAVMASSTATATTAGPGPCAGAFSVTPSSFDRTPRSLGTRIGDIRDGTSQTLLFSEGLAGRSTAGWGGVIGEGLRKHGGHDVLGGPHAEFHLAGWSLWAVSTKRWGLQLSRPLRGDRGRRMVCASGQGAYVAAQPSPRLRRRGIRRRLSDHHKQFHRPDHLAGIGDPCGRRGCDQAVAGNFMLNRNACFLITLAVAALPLAAGCGKPAGSVSGSVSYQGRPVANGAIIFFPEDGKGPDCAAPSPTVATRWPM